MRRWNVRERLRGAAAIGLGLAVLVPATGASAAAPTRYSLANGCYALQGPSGRPVAGGERLRMQATTLGSYLLYRPDRTFLAAQGDGVGVADQPSPAADWRVDEESSGTFRLSPASGGGPELSRMRFVPTDGCAVYPEAELDATGTPLRGQVPYARVGGLVEGHMHWMTFEYLGGNFHCGRPWHPYGIPYALPDCSSVEGPQGSASPTQNFLNFGNPGAAHDTRGYPQMTSWGRENLTYEGTYWRWVERAWLGGLRLMVMGVNENRVLCQLQANRQTNCDEMDTVRRGFEDIRELQRYVDAQAGGPGKGFFQIVTDPYQARRVINQGKLAVVLEIEISELFGCRGWEQPSCDRAQVDRQLDEMYRLGVRSSLLLNKFDNPLTGVRFDSGPVGALINAGNKESSGSFWSARTCTGPYSDNTIEQPPTNAQLDDLLGKLGVQSGTFPTYPPPPHCNTRGLTTLGRHVVQRMMDLRMIVNPDHMSQAAVEDTLSLLEARNYSGVISPHGWMDPGNWPRLWKLGGLALPGHSRASDYVQEWRKYRPRSTPFLLGWGYGADLGGLSEQPAPSEDGSISYPFKSFDGRVTFERQRTGERTFDYRQEGVSHYGLYADWFADLRRIGGEELTRDMWNGAEAYLDMWERADGIPVRGCYASHRQFTSRGLPRMRLGVDWTRLLREAGQPQQRTRVWTWCSRGKTNARAADVAILDDAGRVQLVGSNARGRRARGFRIGSRATRLRRSTRSIGGGVRVKRTRRAVWVYVVRRGRIRAEGVATRALGRRRSALRRAALQLLTARATQTKPDFVPNLAQAARRGGAVAGRTLAGSTNVRLNNALALLCRLQVQG